MVNYDRICSTCEFYEAFRDRANCGQCLLDLYGDDGLTEVKADDSCSYWLGRSEED